MTRRNNERETWHCLACHFISTQKSGGNRGQTNSGMKLHVLFLWHLWEMLPRTEIILSLAKLDASYLCVFEHLAVTHNRSGEQGVPQLWQQWQCTATVCLAAEGPRLITRKNVINHPACTRPRSLAAPYVWGHKSRWFVIKIGWKRMERISRICCSECGCKVLPLGSIRDWRKIDFSFTLYLPPSVTVICFFLIDFNIFRHARIYYKDIKLNSIHWESFSRSWSWHTDWM